jgi:glycosyltransferase involved in cell wall biosynthesis
MKIFMSDMHNTIPFSFGKAFAQLGHELLLAGYSFGRKESRYTIKYGRKWTQKEVDNSLGLPNIRVVEVDNLFSQPPDVIMIMCDMVEKEILKIWNDLKVRTKLLYYSGNDYQPYDFNVLQNILAADIGTLNRAKRVDKHVLQYWPWVNYDEFCWDGPSDEPIFRTYIHNYRNLFKTGYELTLRAMNVLEDKIVWHMVDNTPKEFTPGLMRESMATMHIKSLEGYGYAIIESLACGRPIFLYRPFTKDRTFTNWCIDGSTAFYFDNVNEFKEKALKLLNDVPFRHNIQAHCSAVIREKINNEEQTKNLGKFLENLR